MYIYIYIGLLQLPCYHDINVTMLYGNFKFPAFSRPNNEW